jgi:NDP-sugar pyrophosphorylase family protein
MKDNRDRNTLEFPEVGQRRPGRLRTSPLTPEQQNAAAQKAKRSKMKEAGYVWRGYWVDQGSIDSLAELKAVLACSSQDEALRCVLRVAGDPGVIAAIAVALKKPL